MKERMLYHRRKGGGEPKQKFEKSGLARILGVGGIVLVGVGEMGLTGAMDWVFNDGL
jgi:hypothetical protein